VSTTPVTQDIGTEIIGIFENPVGEIITALGLDLKVDIHDFFGHFEFDISFAAHGTYTVPLWPPKNEDPKKQNVNYLLRTHCFCVGFSYKLRGKV